MYLILLIGKGVIDMTIREFFRHLYMFCALFAFVFLFMFFLGAGFYFGATAGGWLPEQEIHCENTNLFPSECVITEVSSVGAKQ